VGVNGLTPTIWRPVSGLLCVAVGRGAQSSFGPVLSLVPSPELESLSEPLDVVSLVTESSLVAEPSLDPSVVEPSSLVDVSLVDDVSVVEPSVPDVPDVSVVTPDVASLDVS
jgi:hypothetical protein